MFRRRWPFADETGAVDSPLARLPRAVYLGLALLLLAAVVVPLVARAGTAVPQPVAFNHRKHTQDLGLNCEFCHAYVRTGAHAGLPDAQTCSMCHQVTQGTSEEAARVTELISQGDPLRFNKLFRLAPHVFYTHRRHAGIGEIECQECHGAIAETERPPDRPLVQVTMDFCISCHREQGQTLDCNACHR
ncbi:MAG: hypothetical protein GTN62_00995 [Gemmatimonadales bacterium]|nr:hypothetical protein [Gemmatimonadales bacterium]NIN48680.1 hypothetical protein [Gemmatimonadales bacterium]NIP06144.1 hypothetical protein [Gemmatimonadales bacterium]NIR01318.1 hypothetical protein [Gemmatimonadales bacterium]